MGVCHRMQTVFITYIVFARSSIFYTKLIPVCIFGFIPGNLLFSNRWFILSQRFALQCERSVLSHRWWNIDLFMQLKHEQLILYRVAVWLFLHLNFVHFIAFPSSPIPSIMPRRVRWLSHHLASHRLHLPSCLSDHNNSTNQPFLLRICLERFPSSVITIFYTQICVLWTTHWISETTSFSCFGLLPVLSKKWCAEIRHVICFFVDTSGVRINKHHQSITIAIDWLVSSQLCRRCCIKLCLSVSCSTI